MKLETTFANKYNTRKLTLLFALMKISQEGTPIADYMQTIKGIVDALSMVDHLLCDVEIVAYILNGLNNNFKELTLTIHA